MAHEPKKRHSRARKGKRRAGIALQVTKAVTCPNCGAPHVSHRVCAACGYYKGVAVLKPTQPKTVAA